MEHQRKRIADGFIELSGGMDSGRNPSILERNKVAFASNVRFRGGFPRNRPGVSQLRLFFRSADPDNAGYDIEDTALRLAFEHGKFQGATIYKSSTGEDYIFCVIGGRFFLIELRKTFSQIFGGNKISGNRVKEILITKRQETITLITIASTQAIGGFEVFFFPLGVPLTLDYPFITVGSYLYKMTDIALNSSVQNVTAQNQSAPTGIEIPIGTTTSFDIQDIIPPSLPMVYFCQAEQFLIIQDGCTKPVIFDGSTLRRAEDRDSNGFPEVPVGTVMAYGNGRLWVAVFGKYFLAGDIVGGPTGTSTYGFNDSILKFTENDYLNEGGYFRVPDQSGEITAMSFIATPDTSLGQGPLQIFTKTHVFSVSVPVDRDEWKNVEFPIQTVSLISNGSVSSRATLLVNGDIFYRAKDGIRSFVVARRDMGQWGNTPISNEVSTVLNADTQSFLPHCSAVLFDNRLLVTATPITANADIPGGRYSAITHDKLAVLDFHPISAMSIRTSPAYDGVWDSGDMAFGINQIIAGNVDGDDHCYLMGLQNFRTTTTAQFTAPSISGTVAVSVSSTQRFRGVGNVMINGQVWRVSSIGSSTSITLTNLSTTASTVFASGTKILAVANQVYELSKDNAFDFDVDRNQLTIGSYFETAAYPFSIGLTAAPSDMMQLKRLEMGELFADGITGTVSFVAKYKSDQAPEWQSWHSWSETVDYRNCPTGSGCHDPSCYNSGYRARMRLPTPADTCETGQTKLTRLGYEFQGRIEWDGPARIKRFRMQANEQQEEATGECRS